VVGARVIPETKYAKSGELSIAYQITGDGPVDVVFVPGLVSHVEMNWEQPTIAHILGRLAAFSRLVLFDKRGTGLSDRTAGLPTLEERADDIRAVMDASGLERAAMYAPSEGGQAAIYFTAAYPDRVTHLVLVTTSSGVGLFSESERVVAVATLDGLIASIEQLWGQGLIMQLMAGSTGGAVDQAMAARFERNCATPHAAADVLRRTMTGDATDILSTISVPTLVISRSEDPLIARGVGPRLAAAIPGARHVEFPGAFHIAGQPELEDDALNAAEEFITGSRSVRAADRVLATVLFTDIVSSTAHAVAMTDPKWRTLLDAHDIAIRQEIGRHLGREVNTTGDGFLATFDGPARAVRCAQAVASRARSMGLELRSGVHTGEVEIRGGDVAGLAVHIGARIAALARASEVLVSSTVRDLTVGSGLEFEDAGSHQLKGVPGEWRLLRVLA
jgi:class 3 adenylate cyclase